jgi:hypothetical protein
MKNQKGFVIPLVIAIVAILAIAGTVYLAEREKPEMSFELVEIDTDDSIQSTSTVATTTIADTRDWKTYKDVKQGFEFLYPPDMIIKNQADAVVLDFPDSRVAGTMLVSAGVKLYVIPSVSPSCFGGDWMPDDPHITLENINFYHRDSGGGFDPQNTHHAYTGVKGDKCYKFLLTHLQDKSKVSGLSPGIFPDFVPSSLHKIFDQIVLSFEFVPATPEKPVACTMDAFMCPNGTYVGRSGPKCEFVCPVATSTNAEVKIGQSITINSIKITPLEVTGDSRCPRATKCVWAGTVNLTVRLQSGDMAQEAALALGENFRFDNKIVTFTKVAPEKTFVQIQPSDYNFSFVVSSI